MSTRAWWDRPGEHKASLLQTSEADMLRKERGDNAAVSGASEETIYKIDIPANRYDMLCLEGIARALNVFQGTQAAPKYTVTSFESLKVR